MQLGSLLFPILIWLLLEYKKLRRQVSDIHVYTFNQCINIQPKINFFVANFFMIKVNKVLTIWDLRYGTLQAECVLDKLKQENPTDIVSYTSLFKFQV